MPAVFGTVVLLPSGQQILLINRIVSAAGDLMPLIDWGK
jgi:hypothetical protein